MGKKSFVLGAAVGYVLGARAGRQSYDKIAAQASRLWGNPKVQSTVSSAKDTALDKGTSLKDAAASSPAAQKVKDKLPGGGSESSSPGGAGTSSGTTGGTTGGSGTGTTPSPAPRVANPVLNTPPTSTQPGTTTPTTPGTTIPPLP